MAAMAERAGLAGRDNWRKYPRAMMRNRVISEGIRSVWPAVISGIYTPEEIQGDDEEMRDITPERDVIEAAPAPAPVVISDAEFTPTVVPEVVTAGLPDSLTLEWESLINESSSAEELKRHHAAAYRAAQAVKDVAALARFETAKNARKAALIGGLS